MRIISGKFRGKTIHPPAGLPVRPTTDRAKEALFNILVHRFAVEGADVLDGFAGTGHVSYEFISRGATSVTAVDEHAGCIQFIRDTFRALGAETSQAVKSDVFRFVETTKQDFDIIFFDPPYMMPHQEKLIQLCFERKLLREQGVLILEHGKQRAFDNHPRFFEIRNYGTTSFSFFAWHEFSQE